MLVNPAWYNRDPELDALISWLETMPANKRYGTKNSFTCLMGRYVRATQPRRPGEKLLPWAWRVGSRSNDLYDTYKNIVNGRWWARTYGAALKRAKMVRQTRQQHSTLVWGPLSGLRYG